MSSSCDTCNENCSAKDKIVNETDQEFLDRQMLKQRMCKVQNKVLVISGKGGVGKSTVASNLAASLAESGKKVGLIDADIHGPSIPKLFNLDKEEVFGNEDGTIIYPINYSENLKVMSIGFLIPTEEEAIIWRGPRKFSLIQQFMKYVEWGELDYLIFDLPPGTGDEVLSITNLIDDITGAVIVTTPQDVAITDVKKSVTFCKQIKIPVLGVIENMSGFMCPKCNEITYIFSEGGASKMVDKMNLKLLGSLPICPSITISGDRGVPVVLEGTNLSKEFKSIINKVTISIEGE